MNYTLAGVRQRRRLPPGRPAPRPSIPQPAIVTESGRALTAHHAVLVTEVLGVDATSPRTAHRPNGRRGRARDRPELRRASARASPPRTSRSPTTTRVQMRDEAMVLFNVGQLTLQRARARRGVLLAHLREDPAHHRARCDYVPDDLANLERDMADTYFLNFSVFQSRARLLGHPPALPGAAAAPPQRGADAPRGAGRHHLRLGRQDRPLHRPARRQAHARAAPAASRTSPTTSASSWSAPTRRSWATCTTCSATRTSCTSTSTSDGRAAPDARRARRPRRRRCSRTSSTSRPTCSAHLRRTIEHVARGGPHHLRGIGAACSSATRPACDGYTYLTREHQPAPLSPPQPAAGATEASAGH